MSNDVDIKVREDGSVVVIRNFEKLATASDTADASVIRLKASLNDLKGTSLNTVANEVVALKTALSSLNRDGAELTSLKVAIQNLGNASSHIKDLIELLNKLGTSTQGLTTLFNILQGLSTGANNIERVNLHLAALPPLVAHVNALHAALSAVVALNPQIAVLAKELRSLAGNRVGIRELAAEISVLNRDIGRLVLAAADIARVLQNLSGAANSANRGMFSLRQTLVGMVAYMAVGQVREWLDAWQSAAGLFKVATDSMAEMAAVQKEVIQIARDTRQEFTPTVELYARLNRASEDLGVSQKDVIGFTKGINTALAIQHTSASQARGALMQLGQAMGFGKVRAQEFNSMNENLPLVLKTVAQNLEGAAGSTVKLRQIMLAGKLTSKEFFEAFMKGAKDLDKDFGKTSVTITQAISVMNTNFIEFIGHLDDALGISNAVGKSFIGMSNALNILIPVTAFAAILYAGTFLPALVGFGGAAAFATRMTKALWGVMVANPTAATIGALVATTLAVASLKDSIELGTKSLVEFNGKTYEARATLGDFLSVLGQDIGNLFGAFGMVLGDWLDQFDIGKKINSLFGEGFVVGLIRSIAKALDYSGAMIRSFFNYIGLLGQNVPDLISAAWGEAGNAIIRMLNGVNTKAMEGVNWIRRQVGIKEQKPKVLEETSVVKAKSFSEINTEAAKDALAMMKELNDPKRWTFGNVIDDIIKRSQEKAEADRLAKLKAEQDMLKKTGGSIIETPEKGVDKLRRQYEALVQQIDAVNGAQLKVVEGEKILQKAKEHGWISEQRRIELVEKLHSHYEDILNPLKAANRELERDIALSKMLPEQRAIEEAYLKQIDIYKKSGLITDRENLGVHKEIFEQYRKMLELRQQQAKVTSIVDEVVTSYKTKREQPLLEDKAYKQILENPDIKDPKKAILNREMEKNPDLFAGTQEQLDAQVLAWDLMYRRIDLLREKDIISERTAAQMKAKVDAQARDQKLKQTNALFAGLAVLQESGSKTAFRIGKAAAIAQATLAMYTSIADAYKAPPGWPLNAGSVIGVTVQQAANLAKVRSVGFMTGGSFDVTGSGGHDSQMVAFRASPGERVSVQTPTQYRKGDPNEQNRSQASSEPRFKIVNNLDPSIVGDYLSTAEGEILIMNTIQKNSAKLRNYVR